MSFSQRAAVMVSSSLSLQSPRSLNSLASAFCSLATRSELFRSTLAELVKPLRKPHSPSRLSSLSLRFPTILPSAPSSPVFSFLTDLPPLLARQTRFRSQRVETLHSTAHARDCGVGHGHLSWRSRSGGLEESFGGCRREARTVAAACQYFEEDLWQILLVRLCSFGWDSGLFRLSGLTLAKRFAIRQRRAKDRRQLTRISP